ncbi:hypothetical protein AOQ84DRAFT_44419 [Glonium stellatum]|uniref:Uncharacterized protein n=1 Tax=Glonium stellatum TaxID=574774 RepID=A0A8E2JT76_9PEZI|nr:hypothetical protein AOQ84DRAFT_44419 [Glonium stellatum]
MATVAHQHQATSAHARSNSVHVMDTSRNSSLSRDTSIAGSAPMASSHPSPAGPPPKKGKGKKSTDPSEQQKQIQAKIAQLELDAAGDKEQEAEIGGSTLSGLCLPQLLRRDQMSKTLFDSPVSATRSFKPEEYYFTQHGIMQRTTSPARSNAILPQNFSLNY